MPVEEGVSKPQTVKMVILAGVLLVVLVFNGKIKKCISTWRMRLAGTTQDGSSPQTDLQGAGQTIEGRLLIPEINRILALCGINNEAGGKALSGKAGQPGQELPDHLERDIFRFQNEGAPAGQPARAAEQKKGAPSKKGIPRFKLEATLTGDNPVAVINNQPLMVGQSISGYRLREIGDRQAVLTRDGQDIILEIAGEEK